jgi:hypothetical protein
MIRSMGDEYQITAFIDRWQGVSGSERSNYQLFITGLCDLLGLAKPEPAHEDTQDNAYVFERRVTFAHGDGSSSNGFIDCYRRGAFVLEAKKVKAGAHTKGFDDALLRARAQAESYARALPASEGRPPFVVVVDVGHVIEVYAEFTRSGATYTPFPDTRSHRIRLADLRDAGIRDRLRKLWQDPMSLDPARASAKVTREVAVQLASVARSLEAAGHPAERVAAFLTRCLFSMFAEDVELLPRTASGDGAFVHLLKAYGEQPETLQKMLGILWADMDRGGFSAALAKDVLRFNGKLFKGYAVDGYVLRLDRDQIDGLLAAAKANWREVEPAIFGTLLERALDPAERHALGAHYTPRAYVERLVLPTVVEPLRADWANAQAAALLLANEAMALPEGRDREKKLAEARAEVKRFHHQLCTVRVLDPACGSGNFLYVTLEHLKRLEGEVLEQLHVLGESQARLGLEGETVTLQQLRGIELNERAAALAELVLWIGYLQWHLRTMGGATIAEPVIHDYRNIEHRDAVLDFDGQEPMRDAAGHLVTRWDGVTHRPHPVTGESVPDDGAQVPQWRYLNPRQAAWPEVDFIVGNPPFIGNKRMRDALGDGYVEALRGAWRSVPESADFVMYWWRHAADAVRAGPVRRFGLITTNSIRQVFNRRVVEDVLTDGRLAIQFAVPDHPWVDSADGAAVRIAMTVVSSDNAVPGRLLEVQSEVESGDGDATVQFRERHGRVGATLTLGIGAPVKRLESNAGMSYMGVILCGDGFFIDDPVAEPARAAAAAEGVVRLYLSGTDLAKRIRGREVVDLTGLTVEAARLKAPVAYQWVHDRVKPVREQSNRRAHRENWWLYGEKRPLMRRALEGLPRYIATARTAKFRVFQFVDARFLAESNVIVVASGESLHLGVLSSSTHTCWADRMGATLEDRPHYTNSTVFEPFPFPSSDTGLTPALANRIGALAEQIDAHRKARQRAQDDLTMTSIYNVLAKLRSEEPLTAKEQVLHLKGLVTVLRSLHDELDAAVLEAYGWTDLLPAISDYRAANAGARAAAVDTLLERLMTLNSKRAAEEAAGTVRLLRPEFQLRARAGEQVGIEIEDVPEVASPPPPPTAKRPWPSGLPEQIKAVAEVITMSARPLAIADLELHFTARGRWRDRLPTIVETLEALGRIRKSPASAERWASA